MAEQYSIAYMYHIFFIHSPVDRHLGRFYVLAIVNITAMNIGVHVSFRTMFFFRYIILSEVSQTEKDKYHMISLICGI